MPQRIAPGWRLAAREIEEAVIGILVETLTNPAKLLEFGTVGVPSNLIRNLLGRAARAAAALVGSPGERANLVRKLVEKVMVDENTLIIKVRRAALLGGHFPSYASHQPSDSAIELTAAIAFKRRGAEIKLVLPGLAQQKHSSRCDPALFRALAAGGAGLENLAMGRIGRAH